MRRITALSAVALSCVLLDACGSRVSGNTYHNNGGVVQIEFRSGGKAFMSTGSSNRVCYYSESDKTVRLVCDSDTTDFTVQGDGALVGPPDSQMSRLTPVKD
jgi:hypothetical protein